jgi:hypothetical protein
MSETLSPRVAEILEESRRALLAHAEAARLGIEGGETLSGGLALEAARARLTEQGIDPDACMEEELAAAPRSRPWASSRTIWRSSRRTRHPSPSQPSAEAKPTSTTSSISRSTGRSW